MDRFTISADLKGGLPLFDHSNIPPSLSPISANKTNLRAPPPIPTPLPPDGPKTAAAVVSPNSKQTKAPPGAAGRPSDADLDIFGAERYYSSSPRRIGSVHKPPISEKDGYLWDANILNPTDELTDLLKERNVNPVSSISSPVDGFRQSRRCTPTASSEASWNSQSGLLVKTPGSISVSVRNLPLKEKKSSRGSGRWRLGRKCPCICTKSIAVDENCSSPSRLSSEQNSPLPARTVGSFRRQEVAAVSADSLPVLSDTPRMTVVVGKSLPVEDSVRYAPKIYRAQITRQTSLSRSYIREEAPEFSFPVLPANNGRPTAFPPSDDPQRDSIDVYSPKGPTRDLVNLPLHSPRRSLNFPVSRDDDAGSDSSSDLFEIESLSTTASSSCPIYRRRDSLDELANAVVEQGGDVPTVLQLRRSMDGSATPPVAPSEFYAPSEASVEWSVTTAEGGDQASIANFSSAVSEADEVGFSRLEPTRAAAAAPIWRGGDLLGCRQGKSVNVVEVRRKSPLQFSVEEGSRGKESGVPVDHLQIGAPEVKIIKVPENRAHVATTTAIAPFPRSLAARVVG